MKKFILVLLTFSLLVFTYTTPDAANNFTDIQSSDWYYDNVKFLVNNNIIDGYPDNTFKPDNTMQVDQFIKTMIIALGYDISNGDDYWAQPYIDKALSLGIIYDGEFSSYTDYINRAQMAKIAVSVVEMLEREKTYKYVGDDEYKIDNHIMGLLPSNYKYDIYKSYELGILLGYPDLTFRPNNALKRSEACTVIRRVIDEDSREPYVDTGVMIIDNLNKNDPNSADFYIEINMNEPLDMQYIQVEEFLTNAIGTDLTETVMDFVKQKNTVLQELPSTYFDWKDGKKIQVLSPSKEILITIRGL